jgi:hypothetical protein
VGYLHTTIAITIATTIAMEPTVYHIPALLNESIEGLAIKPDGNYVDGTLRENARRLVESGYTDITEIKRVFGNVECEMSDV